MGKGKAWPSLDPCNNANILAPAVFERSAQIPFTGGTVLDPVQYAQIVAPGQLYNELLHN